MYLIDSKQIKPKSLDSYLIYCVIFQVVAHKDQGLHRLQVVDEEGRRSMGYAVVTGL